MPPKTNQLGERAGLPPSSKPLRNIFGEALLAVATEDPRVVVLDGDLGNSTKAETVRQAFPERFFNIGIAESNLVGVGAGLAACGFVPWITSFSSFLLCNAYDQLRLAVAMSNINAKVLGSHGGITLGKDGPYADGHRGLCPRRWIAYLCDAGAQRPGLHARRGQGRHRPRGAGVAAIKPGGPA